MKQKYVRPGDICIFWNKLVIVHTVDASNQWAEVIKIKNPNKPADPVGKTFSVRVSHLTVMQKASTGRIKR